MTRHLLTRVLTIMGVFILCAGATSSSCSSSDDDDDDGNSERPSFVADLTLRNVRGENVDTFRRRESIDLILTVRNRLNTSAEIEFDDARQSDFVIVNENTTSVVWQWSESRTFAAGLTSLTFAAGETKEFVVTWDQRNNAGNFVLSRSYEARGALVYDNFDDEPLRSNQQASTLKRFIIED